MDAELFESIAGDAAFFEMVERFAAVNDLNRLRLRHHGDAIATEALNQAECRRRTRRKLRATLERCGRFLFPNSLAAEQASGDLAAACHADIVGEGLAVADLTAGLGIDTLAFARRGCRVTAFDLKPDNVRALLHNAACEGLAGRVTAVEGDSLEWLAAHPDARFDVVYADPARRDTAGGRVFDLSACQPDIPANLPLIMAHCRRLVVKLSPMADIRAVVGQLPAAERIIVVGTPTECKEIVAVAGSDPAAGVALTALTLTADGAVALDTTVGPREAEAAVAASLPAVGQWVYEPWPAVMKALVADVITSRWPVAMLGRDTQLFLADGEIDGFPGTGRRIVRVERFASRTASAIARERLTTNVATRNFPLQAPELARKLKIREGGTGKLYGARCGAGLEPTLIFTTD